MHTQHFDCTQHRCSTAIRLDGKDATLLGKPGHELRRKKSDRPSRYRGSRIFATLTVGVKLWIGMCQVCTMRDQAYKALLEHTAGDSSPMQVRVSLLLYSTRLYEWSSGQGGKWYLVRSDMATVTYGRLVL